MWKTLKDSFDSPDSYVSLALGLAVVLVVGMIAFNYFKVKMQTQQTSEEKTKQTQEATKLPAKHTVTDGETLWSIAETYYKSGYNWVDISEANTLANADDIQSGQTLIIPDVSPKATPTGDITPEAATQTHAAKSYTINSGDSLWTISVAQYGSGYRWPEIAEVNHLANPDLIFAGNVLTLP
jgi:nucleoid-associated protein YgaU